mgnify:CR=1 FL=1
MNYKKLIEWDIYDDQVAIDLINHNKHCDVNSMRKYTNRTHYIIKCLSTSDSSVSGFLPSLPLLRLYVLQIFQKCQ